MKHVTFYKYQGTGNDFILIDNRLEEFPKENQELIEKLCDRKFGIGADGLILLENDDKEDFKMVYFNADGRESTMCGNGGRCIVSFAHLLKVFTNNTTFNAIDGLHHASITANGIVALQMIDVVKDSIVNDDTFTFLFTGSPHHVVLVDDVEYFDVYNQGKQIRYSDMYAPSGTNVNFVEQLTPNKFKIRTYERGVEDETLSCGTGATAVAIAMNTLGLTQANTISIEVQGGMVEISFDQNEEQFFNVMLTGPAKLVFTGEIAIE